MRLRATFRAFLSVFLVLGLISCRKTDNSAQKPRLLVVCTFLPVYVLTQNVVYGVPGVEVRLLLAANAGCPHDYMLTPTEAVMLEKADVLVLNGLGMEQFLRNNPALTRTGTEKIEAGEAVDTLLTPREHSTEQAEDRHEHSGVAEINPHGWVSPFQAARMARFIGDRLAQIDSPYSEEYRAHAQAYAARLDSLGHEFEDLVARAQNKRIVTFHHAFDYLARDVGLEIMEVVEPSPGVEPSAKSLAQLAKEIKARRPAALFSEPQYSNRLVETLASETGVVVLVLDPAASGDSDPQSYLKIMRQNLLTLRRALLPAE